MENQSLVKRGLINAFAAAVYVVAIANLMYFGFSRLSFEDNITMPITMLLLLVFSVAVMGYLLFAKPVMLYLDGAKQDAVRLLGYTIGWLGALTLIAVVIMVLVSRP